MTPTTTMYFTLLICAVIVTLLLYFLVKPTVKNITTAPSILTGIGIFGTFLGITIGLMNFNPDNIVASVPIFLSGIKLAFWSSVVGILASLIHKIRFTINPLQHEFAADEMETSTVESLKQMTLSLNNIERMNADDGRNAVINELGGFLHTFGEQLESGLLTNVQEEPYYISADALKADEAVLASLKELKDEVTRTSSDEQNIVKDQMQSLLGELKDGVIAGTNQSASLLEVLAGLKEQIGTEDEAVVAALRELKEELVRSSTDEQNIVKDQMQHLLGELKQGVIAGNKQSETLLEVFAGLKEYIGTGDQAVLASLKELKAELAKNSVEEQKIVKDQMQRMLDELKKGVIAANKQSESVLGVFSGLKEQLGAESEKSRKLTQEQMETLFAGLTQTAAGTLGELSDLAGNLVSQAKWQASTLAQEISASNEISAKSMISMLKEILAATEDANHKITTELGKLRGDVAADLRATNDQSTALLEQLHAMTESYKASLISTVTDLKAQISKDMKASYNLVDTYTKAVADVTGTNQVEALERMEAIANIMQGVVQSSSDMSSLLHDNAAAMNQMKEAFTGTNEGSLGRFLLNMNEDLIEHITSLQHSLDAQGSLGNLMQDMNTETNLRLKGLEKAFEGSVFEIKQLPQEFVKGMSKLGAKNRHN